MSKRASIIVLLVVAVCLGAVASVYFIEKNTAQSIRQSLQQHDITVAHIKYSFFDKSLEMADIHGPNSLVKGGTFHIGRITASKVNPEAFSPQATGYPQVADEVIFSDIHVEVSTDKQSLNYSLQSMRALGWKQNLGKVFSPSTKNDLTAYVHALMDCYVKEIHITESRTLTKGDGLQGEDYFQSSVLKELSPTSMGSYEVKNMKMRQAIDHKTYVHMMADRLFLGASHMPSADLLAFLLQLGLTPQELTAAQEQSLTQHLHSYFSTGLKPNLTLEGLQVAQEIAGSTSPIFSTEKFTFTANYDATAAQKFHFDVNIGTTEFNFSLVSSHPAVQNVVQNMLGTLDLKAHSALQGKIHSQESSSSLDLSFGVQDLGEADLDLHFILPLKKLSEVLQAQDNINFLFATLSQVQLASLKLRLKDEGFLPRSLISASKYLQLPVEEAYPIVLQSMEKELLILRRYINEKNYASVQQCLQAPGTLEWVLQPDSPMPFMVLAMLVSSAPAELPLQSICTPGTPLVEAAQTLLP